MKTRRLDDLATELADTLVQYDADLKTPKALKKKRVIELDAARKAASAAAPATAPVASAASTAVVRELRDEISVATGKVQLPTQLQKDAKEEQRAAIRASMVQEAEITRLKKQLNDMAAELTTARAQLTALPMQVASAKRPPDEGTAPAAKRLKANPDPAPPATAAEQPKQHEAKDATGALPAITDIV